MITACLLLLIPACGDTTLDNDTGGKAGASTLILSYTVEGIGSEIATRVAVEASADEINIGTLTLFFFEPSSNRSGRLVDWVELSGSPLPAGSAISIPTAGKAISASNAYHIIGVANAAGYMHPGWEIGWVGRNEAEFRDGALASLPGGEGGGIASASLLMSGSSAKTAGNGHFDMRLTRNVARFDVGNKADGYSLVSAQLRNIYTASSVTGDAAMTYALSNKSAREGFSATINHTSSAPIKGKLYAFENQTTAPAQGDRVTTCLLVGLLKNGSQYPVYFRINVHPKEAGQNIRRNKVYAVCISEVNGMGYATFDEAYTGTREGELGYTINNWDLDGNELIVSDSYSILALPAETVEIGKDGATISCTITTLSTLESPSPLAIKSMTLDGGLAVSLGGNTLTITAPDLQTLPMREGHVTLAYAGLEATMNIVQSPKTELFLKLSYEMGWSGLLGPNEGEESKTVYVNASGSWKAVLIGDEGFSFDPDGELKEITVGSPNGDFKIYTVSLNPSKTVQRNAYVIIALDDDPLNCVGVVSLTQTVAGDYRIFQKFRCVSSG